MNSESPALKRSLTLPLLTLYGLGNILGGRDLRADNGAMVAGGNACSRDRSVAAGRVRVDQSALWVLQRKSELTQNGFSLPRWIPVAGFTASVAFLGYQLVAEVTGYKKAAYPGMPPDLSRLIN